MDVNPTQNQAWFWTGPGKIEHRTVAMPEIDNDEVLMQVKAVGVCGTDLGILAGKNPNAHSPLPLGHEISGQVVQCGLKTGVFQVGDRVFLDPYIGCGHCPACRNGNKTYCTGGGRHFGIHIPGGWQEYLAVPERNCYHVPGSLSYAEASQAETLYTVMSAVKRLQVKIGASALVIGDGPTGLLFARLLPLLGCTSVTVSGHHSGRLELAQNWGASIINENIIPFEPAPGTEARYDIAIDTVGSPSVVNQAVWSAAPGGQVILFGLPPGGKPVPIDTMSIVMREISLLGATDNPSTWPAVINVLERGFVNIKEMITATFPFDQLPQAVEAAKSKQTVKIILSREV